MDLQQEYFRRHAITTPLVVFPDNHGNYTLVLRTTRGKPQTILIKIVYTKQELHPPYYKFLMQQATRDGQAKDSYLRVVWESKIYWDEWENFVVQWAESNRGELVPVNGQELEVALWEMFLYSHDSWLAANLVDRLKDSVYTAVDANSTADVRLAAAVEIEEFVRGKNRGTAAALADFRSYTDKHKFYAKWLADLL